MIPVPPDVDKRIRRGWKKTREDATKRRLCQLFLSGEIYSYLNDEGSLRFPATAPGIGKGKPAHRIRNRYNFIRPIVDAKVSSSTSKTPGYEVNPTGTDPAVVAAAHLSEKVLRMGFDHWYLREARTLAAELAIGGGGSAFALPYFDPLVGPFVEHMDPETGAIERFGEGEIKVMVLSGNEVAWEPGVEFYHSRWYVVRTARPIDETKALPGYKGGPLMPDASVSDQATNTPSSDKVLVTYYFERPSPDYPQGRMMTIAGDRQIMPQAPYPLAKQGVAIDRPCLHRLVYRHGNGKDADLGLTWELIDFQRTAADCYNKILELKNRALNLRILAPVGSLTKGPPTDEPGGITYFNPVGSFKPEWEAAPDPNILQQLMAILSRTLDDMRYVSADADVSVAPNVAANAVAQVMQQAANRWGQYVGDLARWDADVASHCLLLVQEHYTEERVLKVRGRYGWEPVGSFKGADIAGQEDVHISPASIETQTRSVILQQIGWIQANFPGYLRPEIAIDIVMTGTPPEGVIDAFEYDKARANLVIQNIRAGTAMEMPTLSMRVPGPPDPLTGQPTNQQAQVPGWMPRPFDNVDVQLWVLQTWMKSDDFTRLPPQSTEQAMLVYEGMKSLQDSQAAAAQAAQSAQAQELGMTNASAPQPKPMPSTPNPGADPGAPPQP